MPLDRPIFLGTPQHPALADADPAPAWRALLARGGTALAEVNGDFAVALTDAAGTTHLAVDRFGMQTLCYRVADGRLRVAERADALADAGTPIDPQAVFDYLFLHAIPSPRTVYEGIHRLPPGHHARFENGRLSVEPYWLPQFVEPQQASFDALRDEFRGLLRAAVKSQLGSHRPACFLSGGTDSSTIAGVIREVSGAGAASYSIGFEAEGYDEMAYARLASTAFGTEHHEYYVTPDDLVRSIADMAAHVDQPFGNSSVLPAYYCAKAARADGVTRLLAGDGGDELFGGNSRYAKQRVFGWYEHLPQALRSGLFEPLLDTALARRLPLLRKGASYVEQARVPLPDRLQMYNMLQLLGLHTVLSDDFLAQVSPAALAGEQRQVWAAAGGGSTGAATSTLNRMLAFDWRYTLAENDLPKVRWATGLAGVGVGFPLLDRHLLDFSLRLPSAYKLKGGELRWFFKEALRGFLPDEIIAKKKHGFGLPFGVWALRHDGLRELAGDALRSFAQRGVIRPAFIDRLLDTHLPAHPGYYGELVWVVMMLEHWLRAHAPGFRVGH